jgi:hypothetical protein
VNVGWLTVPEGVPSTLKLPSDPVNVGWLTLPAGVNFPEELILLPVNLRLTPVPVNAGALASAFVIPVTIVLLVKLGSFTVVGVFGVNEPSVQLKTRFSLLTVVLSVGIVALAAVPAVTVPPPVAEDATYPVEEAGVTVIVGAATLPLGV